MQGLGPLGPSESSSNSEVGYGPPGVAVGKGRGGEQSACAQQRFGKWTYGPGWDVAAGKPVTGTVEGTCWGNQGRPGLPQAQTRAGSWRPSSECTCAANIIDLCGLQRHVPCVIAATS